MQRHLAVALSYARPVQAALCATLASAAFGAHGAALIALDTGHNIATQGAISARGLAEFDFNRSLVLALDRQLRDTGYRTELIAIEGQTTDLASRPRRAREAGAALFISVHHDSARARFLRDWEYEGKPRKYLDDRFQGFSLFVSRQNPQWRQALDCASAAGASLRAAGFRPSRYHADPLMGEAREFADEANGVHFFDNLAVLRNATIPALLFEAGVIVNREEEARLATDATRARIAAAFAQAMPACAAAAAIAPAAGALPGVAPAQNFRPVKPPALAPAAQPK